MGNYLRKSFPIIYIESYFYYIILICVFGIYGIWGLAFMRIVLDQITISNVLISTFSQIIPYLGFPFLIMAWYMFLKFCYEISGLRISKSVSIIYFLFHIIFFMGLGWSILKSGDNTLKISRIGLIYIYIVLDVILTSWGLLVIWFGSRKTFSAKVNALRSYILITFLLILLKMGTVIIFYYFPISIPAFILIYFLAIAGPLLYFYFNINTLINSHQFYHITHTIDSLMARFGISKREREIIEQVCSGKSNQEIADTLFISLQTVKDHTHRIYLKMDIKNRVQLINIMQAGRTK